METGGSQELASFAEQWASDSVGDTPPQKKTNTMRVIEEDAQCPPLHWRYLALHTSSTHA